MDTPLQVLTPSALTAALAELPAWHPVPDRPAIGRRYRFADFKTAFAFMGRVATVAEQLGHHPEWLNVYDRIDVVLTTHDACGVTALDLRLARAMDALALG